MFVLFCCLFLMIPLAKAFPNRALSICLRGNSLTKVQIPSTLDDKFARLYLNNASFKSIRLKLRLGDSNSSENIAHIEALNEEAAGPLKDDPATSLEVLTDSSVTEPFIVTNNNNGMSETGSLLILNFVAVLWGTQHVCIKSALMPDAYSSPSVLNFWRFFLSTLLFSNGFLSSMKEGDPRTIRNGLELGLWTFLGFAFQAIGLETTTASRSAFLLYLNVKLVPFFAFVLLRRSISGSTWFAALLAFSGTALLSNDGAPPNVGDLWCIAAAAASAMFILRLEGFSRESRADRLNGVSFATVTVLCSLWLAGDAVLHGNGGIAAGEIGFSTIGLNLLWPSDSAAADLFRQIVNPFLENPLPAVYLGIITTALCNYLQTIGQRQISAERAAVVYSMDPVYGAFFSRLILDERLGELGYLGVGFILAGVAFSAYSSQININGKEK